MHHSWNNGQRLQFFLLLGFCLTASLVDLAESVRTVSVIKSHSSSAHRRSGLVPNSQRTAGAGREELHTNTRTSTATTDILDEDTVANDATAELETAGEAVGAMSIIQTSEDESHRANATMTLVRETSIYDLNGAAEKVVPDLENAQDEYLRLFCGGDWIRSGLDGKNSLFEYLLEDSGACAITRKTGLNFGQEFVKAGSCCVQDCPTFWVPTITEFSLHLNADTPYYFAPPYSLVKRCARLAE